METKRGNVKNKLLKFSIRKQNDTAEEEEDDVVDISNEVLLGDTKTNNKRKRKCDTTSNRIIKKRKSSSDRRKSDTQEEDKVESEANEEIVLKSPESEVDNDQKSPKSGVNNDQKSPNSGVVNEDNIKNHETSELKEDTVQVTGNSLEKTDKIPAKVNETPPKSDDKKSKSMTRSSKKSKPDESPMLTMDRFIIKKKTPEEVEKAILEKKLIDDDDVMIVEDKVEKDSEISTAKIDTQFNCVVILDKMIKPDEGGSISKVVPAAKCEKLPNMECVINDVSENVSISETEDAKDGGSPNEDESPLNTSFNVVQETSIIELQDNSITELQDTSITEPQETSITEPQDTSITEAEDISITEPQDTSITEPQDTSITEPQDISLNSVDHNTSVNDIPSSNSSLNSTSECRTPETRRANKLKTPISSSRSLLPKKLTPKQIEKQEILAKKLEEKEKARLEREQKKLEEEEKKRKDKEEKEKQKRELEEQKRLEREEKEKQKKELDEQRKKEKEEKEKQKKELEEQRKREREEKEQIRLQQIELKNKEKLQKEEERKAKEEEKKKKEEAEKDKQEKEKAAFASFFVAKKTISSDSKIEESRQNEINCVGTEKQLKFMPFEIKGDMRMAPTFRTEFTSERSKRFDDIVQDQYYHGNLYLTELKSLEYVPGKCDRTWPVDNNAEPDVLILESEFGDDCDSKGGFYNYPTKQIQRRRAKLLQFHENRRPPYFGTWSKKTKIINARNPFKQDETIFEYDVDSDEEWEDEGEGESLRGSDDENEKEEDNEDGNDDYEVDNQMFVPHGYLSDEEEQDENVDPEAHKMKLKLMEMEFEEQMKKKTERLQPRLVGCVYLSNNGQYSSSNIGNHIRDLLVSRRAVYAPESIPIIAEEAPSQLLNSPTTHGSDTSNERFCTIPDEEFVDLIKLLHGNRRSIRHLEKEFHAFVSQKNLDKQMSHLLIKRTIKEIADWMMCPLTECAPNTNPRMCWFVKAEVRENYGLENLFAFQHSWKYIVEPPGSDKKEISFKEDKDLEEGTAGEEVSSQKQSTLITKFTKVLSEEERIQQLSKISSPKTIKNEPKSCNQLLPNQTINKKRATLITLNKDVNEEKEIKIKEDKDGVDNVKNNQMDTEVVITLDDENDDALEENHDQKEDCIKSKNNPKTPQSNQKRKPKKPLNSSEKKLKSSQSVKTPKSNKEKSTNDKTPNVNQKSSEKKTPQNKKSPKLNENKSKNDKTPNVNEKSTEKKNEKTPNVSPKLENGNKGYQNTPPNKKTLQKTTNTQSGSLLKFLCKKRKSEEIEESDAKRMKVNEIVKVEVREKSGSDTIECIDVEDSSTEGW